MTSLPGSCAAYLPATATATSTVFPPPLGTRPKASRGGMWSGPTTGGCLSSSRASGAAGRKTNGAPLLCLLTLPPCVASPAPPPPHRPEAW